MLALWFAFIQHATESLITLISFNQMNFALFNDGFDFHCCSEVVLTWASWPSSGTGRTEALGVVAAGEPQVDQVSCSEWWTS